jgi:DNA primase
MAIPDAEVQRVRAATHIVALIEERTALIRQGGRWVGLCPFHNGTTPSLNVIGEEGFYYCSGCQARDDAISFVRSFDHLGFDEAIWLLAEKGGITIRSDV